MGSKEKIILEIFKRNKGKYLQEIVREYNLNYATVHKWYKLFEAQGKIKTKKLGNLVIIEDVFI
ncbi:MAG: hypothetical protein NC926_10315 [Candidatus Omnitrophica bacterium]|nr:hypothetical protein [Candidatus Omnitrophota bacterium]